MFSYYSCSNRYIIEIPPALQGGAYPQLAELIHNQSVTDFKTPVVQLNKFDYLPEAGCCPS